MENGILHVDMNNFYASVETLFAPQYKDVPMAVAGDKESRHGIILAKNMLAKSMGVQTAEPIWQAMRKCPNLQLVPPHRERYLQYSRMAQEIYYRFTDQVEAFSLDECWLDVYGSERLFGDGEQIAQQIRQAVKEELSADEASVIISRRPCALLKYVKHKAPLAVNKDKCIGCKSCMKIGCPAISMKEGKAHVDFTQCVGCGVCEQLCPVGAFESTGKEG